MRKRRGGRRADMETQVRLQIKFWNTVKIIAALAAVPIICGAAAHDYPTRAINIVVVAILFVISVFLFYFYTARP